MNPFVLDFLVLFFLLLINGFLAMAEIAIVSSNRIKIESLAKKNKGAKAALALIDDPGSFLSTIQMGITIISIVSGAFTGQRFAEPLGAWLNEFPMVHKNGNLIAYTTIVMIVTYISLVIGELIPKRIALSKSEAIAILLARPIHLLTKLTYPFVFILDISAKLVMTLFRQTDAKKTEVTEEEIHSVMQQGLDVGAIGDFEHKTFLKVLEFGDRDATVIMTPRIKVIYLDLDHSLEDNIKKILANPHRYYPVFKSGLDDFLGIIDAKDALSQQLQGKPLELTSLIKEAPVVIEGNLGPELLDQFKKNKTHIAIVIDEYGMMQGIITLVDIFETLIDTIPDAHQEKHYEFLKREDGSWLCDGLTPIDKIEEILETEIITTEEEDNFNTLAGFLLDHFKYIPKAGEYFIWQAFKFEIMDMDGTRIDKVLISRVSSLDFGHPN